MVSVDRVTKTYNTKAALNDVSIAFESGEIVGLMGPNGAGKSTLLRILSGLVQPTKGTVSVWGYDVDTQAVEAKRRLGYVPEASHLYDALTTSEFLDFVGALHGLDRTAVNQRGAGLLAGLAIDELVNVPLAKQSKGQRQKAVLAAALLHEPRVLLCDEPFDGLDVAGIATLVSIFRQMSAHGGLALVCSHSVGIVETLCSRVVILDRGSIVYDDSVGAMRAASKTGRIEDVYASVVQAAP